MTEAAKKTEVATLRPDDGFVGMMERLAANPDIPTDKLRELLEMQKDILRFQAEREAGEAMARVQAKLPTVVKDADNTQTNSKYSKHETIAKAIKPVYTAEGFSITFSEESSPKEGHVRVIGVLRHSAGHKENHHLDVPLDEAGIKGTVNKTKTHATGSTYTYGRRYLTCMIFDVATGDDVDGNQPQDTLTEEQAANLEALITETGADKEKFLKWARVESIGQIPAKSYEQCVKTLERKRAK